MNEDQFRQQLREHGYADAKVKEYEANMNAPMHTHEFSVMLYVLSGEFTLALEAGSRTYARGDWCELPGDTMHSERTGPSGATVLVAVK